LHACTHTLLACIPETLHGGRWRPAHARVYTHAMHALTPEHRTWGAGGAQNTHAFAHTPRTRIPPGALPVSIGYCTRVSLPHVGACAEQPFRCRPPRKCTRALSCLCVHACTCMFACQLVNVNVNELRLGFSNTTRNPEGTLSHNNRKSLRHYLPLIHVSYMPLMGI
jgi:hypothetical protein